MWPVRNVPAGVRPLDVESLKRGSHDERRMSRELSMDRRAYVRALGAGGFAVGVAGCIGNGNGDGNGGVEIA